MVEWKGKRASVSRREVPSAIMISTLYAHLDKLLQRHYHGDDSK